MNAFLSNLMIGLLWSAAIGGLVWYGLRTATRLQYVTLADGQRLMRKLPFTFRLLLPFTVNFTGFFSRPAFEASRKKLSRTLTSSGMEGLINPQQFLSLRLLYPIVFGAIAILVLQVVFTQIPGSIGTKIAGRIYIFQILVVLFCYQFPAMWLRSALKERHRQIERALPFVLDLLTLSVEAGLDFMTAIQRIVEKRKVDPLGEELIRTFREVQLGKTRKEALRSLGARVNQIDVTSVVHALVQADELGVSIGSILRIQANQLRIRRFQRAEKAANEAPVKMLIPLSAFIFPAVFIILLGPVILQFMQDGF